jgi:alanine-glyoxylate transaminase/serine-glyoxylate transaminase/serine-pyruvate transaminase
LLLLDAVTSLGGIPLKIDEWGIDAAYSASQKNLGVPSGLAPITISPLAQEKIEKRKTKVASFYLDLQAYAAYWGAGHAYHHTASSSLHFALVEGLRLLAEEGLEAAFSRFRANAVALWTGLEDLGAHPFIPLDFRLPPLTTARVPAGVDPHQVRSQLLTDYNIEIAAGFGALKDQVWRIGLMGYSSRREYITLFLGALRELLGK